MVPKRRRAQKKVDYAASLEDRRRLTAYINKSSFSEDAGKRNFTGKEKLAQFLILLLGSSLILAGLYFVFF